MTGTDGCGVRAPAIVAGTTVETVGPYAVPEALGLLRFLTHR